VKTPFLYYLFKTQLGRKTFEGLVHKPIGGLSIHISSSKRNEKKQSTNHVTKILTLLVF
jgi:hypothetical protein